MMDQARVGTLGDEIGCFFRLREHTVSGLIPCAHSGLDKL
jgi:hypothetical protein